MEPHLPRIPAVFAGKNVFVTGGTGFLGKVLVEKLLRSCPDVGDIYVLLRAKKGKLPTERLKEITEIPLFDKLRETNPSAFNKLKLITGDTTLLGLGISPSDRQLLINTINIVYHAAASIRFDDPLHKPIILNTRGTRETVLLAQEFKYLDVFVHLSTTYSNTNRKVVDEELYPEHADWRMAIRMAEELDGHVLEVLTQKYLGVMPNTYTFTKQLAEHVVNDLCKGRMPAIVVRPSIVLSSLDDPIPGWLDNFNGPIGLLAAGGKGIHHYCYINDKIKPNNIPVDICIKGIIVATWYQIIKTNKKQCKDVAFYNACSSDVFNVSFEEMFKMGFDMLGKRKEVTFGPQLWYPTFSNASTKFTYNVQFIIVQFLPSLLLDGILKLTKRKPFLSKLQRKIYIASQAVECFCFNSWTFLNAKFMALNEEIPMVDKNDFCFYHENVDPYSFYKNGIIGCAKYMFHVDPDDDNQRKTLTRLKCLHYFVVYTFYTLLVVFAFNYLTTIFD